MTLLRCVLLPDVAVMRARPDTSGAGCDLRWGHTDGGGGDRRRDASDRAGLGAQAERTRAGWPGRRQGPGPRPLLEERHRAALAKVVEDGPIPVVHGVVRWRVIDLCQWLYDEFAFSVSKQTLARELRALGCRKLSARPRHHAQAAGAVEAFKKVSPRAWTRSRACRVSAVVA
jgi:hypothetical protein